MRSSHLITLVMLMTYLKWGNSSKVSPEVLKELESALLPLFGLKDRPKIEGQIEIPKYLKDLYNKQQDFDLDTASIPMPGLHTQSANTVRSFVHIESPIDGRFKHDHKFRLKFSATLPAHEVLKAAELRLTAEATKTYEKSLYRIILKDIIKRGVKGIDGPITRIIDSKLIDLSKNSTISLDVLPAVSRWISNPKSNFGLLVIIQGSTEDRKKNLRLRRSAHEDEEVWGSKQPLLITYSDDGKNVQKTGMDMLKLRSKRASRPGRKSNRDPCRRRTMYVNFRDVGWSDWIVAPLGYDAFYCDGECEYPMAEHLNTTNHAIVQSLMNSARPLEVPKPCCVPTQLSSMSMLYVHSPNKVVLKNYKDMVVNGCGCR